VKTPCAQWRRGVSGACGEDKTRRGAARRGAARRGAPLGAGASHRSTPRTLRPAGGGAGVSAPRGGPPARDPPGRCLVADKAAAPRESRGRAGGGSRFANPPERCPICKKRMEVAMLLRGRAGRGRAWTACWAARPRFAGRKSRSEYLRASSSANCRQFSQLPTTWFSQLPTAQPRQGKGGPATFCGIRARRRARPPPTRTAGAGAAESRPAPQAAAAGVAVAPHSPAAPARTPVTGPPQDERGRPASG